MKKKLYAIYDIKENEQCVGIFDNLQEAVKFLGLKNVNVLLSEISKKNKIKHRYIVERIEEE